MCVCHPNSTRYVTELSLPHSLSPQAWYLSQFKTILGCSSPNDKSLFILREGRNGRLWGNHMVSRGEAEGGISARQQSVNRYLTANQLTKWGGGGEGIIRMLQSLIGDPVPFIVTQLRQLNTSGAQNDKQ